MITVERVSNGWIIKNRYGLKSVYLNETDMLLTVYHSVSRDWHAGDTVQVMRDGKVKP